ncbi:hypothetical protein ACRRTK_008141 [Alexandromys fortis]
MDGDRDRDPHWSTGLSSQGPNEEQMEGEHEQGCQDHGGLHPPTETVGADLLGAHQGQLDCD